MTEKLLYKTALEEKISSFVVSDGDIVNYDSRYNEKKKCLEIALDYRDFTVLMYYSKFDLYGYSFLENDNSQNQLVTKFLFPFSKIPYSIYDVHNAVDDRVFDTYDFHCLYNESRLLEAADTVFAFISRNKNLLFSINENETLKNKLEASFDRGLKLASKKITREKISQDPEKYLYNHDVALYLYRTGESTLTDAVNHSKKGQLQRFFAKESKKDRLLTYEERYLEYLYENDFNAADGKVEERVKTQQSVSNRIESSNKISLLVSLVLSVALEMLIVFLDERQIEREYYLLTESEISSVIPFVIMLFGFYFIVSVPIKRIMMKKNKNYDIENDSDSKRTAAVLALIGVLVVAGVSAYTCFDYRKAVAINENEVYYCAHIGKVEKLDYSELSFYMIEGEYTGDGIYSDSYYDKRLIIVKGDDYENAQISDYFEYLDVPRSIIDSLEIKGTFKESEDFYTAVVG